MQNQHPKVSVLTPIFNTNPEHLRAMIESILGQTFQDFEFLILNDSPENQEIEEIVSQYAAQDNRIKYFKNDKNMGITPSRNKLLEMATGEYIAVFDHDDISVPERLEKEVEYLDSHPYVGVVSGWLKFFGDKDDLWTQPEKNLDIKTFMTEECSVFHTASMMRKSVLIDNNIHYEEKFSPAEDYRLWAKLMDVTDFHNIQEILVKYRWHNENTTIKRLNKMIEMHDEIQAEICERHPFLRKSYVNNYGTRLKLRLFGILPILKIKNRMVLLFDVIPLFKIKKWKY